MCCFRGFPGFENYFLIIFFILAPQEEISWEALRFRRARRKNSWSGLKFYGAVQKFEERDKNVLGAFGVRLGCVWGCVWGAWPRVWAAPLGLMGCQPASRGPAGAHMGRAWAQRIAQIAIRNATKAAIAAKVISGSAT